jgi:hypothetical protein
MPVGVVPDADDRHRPGVARQPAGVGGGRPLVGDLEDVGPDVAQLGLGDHLHVAAEEDLDAVQLHEQHQGLVVGRVVAAVGAEHGEGGLGGDDSGPRRGMGGAHARLPDPGQEPLRGLSVLRPERMPHRPHRPPPHHRLQPGQVIGVGVGGNEQVDSVHPVPGEGAVEHHRVRSPVHQHRHLGAQHEDGVALTDVEDDHRRTGRLPPRRPDQRGRQRGTHRRETERRHPLPDEDPRRRRPEPGPTQLRPGRRQPCHRQHPLRRDRRQPHQGAVPEQRPHSSHRRRDGDEGSGRQVGEGSKQRYRAESSEEDRRHRRLSGEGGAQAG